MRRLRSDRLLLVLLEAREVSIWPSDRTLIRGSLYGGCLKTMRRVRRRGAAR